MAAAAAAAESHAYHCWARGQRGDPRATSIGRRHPKGWEFV